MAEEESNAAPANGDVAPMEVEKPFVEEEDATEATGPVVKEGSCGINIEDTTLNVLKSSAGNHIMALADGGLQYLLAGLRGNTGVKAGRYMYEVLITEFRPLGGEGGRQLVGSKPMCYISLGFSTSDAPLLQSDESKSVSFDIGGYLREGTKSRAKAACTGKWSQGQVLGLLLNLDATSPHANTLSLFIDGVRASKPQPIGEALEGKVLYPSIMFRCMTLQANFGKGQLRPLPFKCLTFAEAALADSEQQAPALGSSSSGKEVLLPVGLPDEGTFDWLDTFLAANRQYTELSSRMLLSWARSSGLDCRPASPEESNNDRPPMHFVRNDIHENSLKEAIWSVVPMLNRSYVVMEVKESLLDSGRKELLERFGSDFKKVARVVVGEPPEAYRAEMQKLILQDKQAASEKAAAAAAAAAAVAAARKLPDKAAFEEARAKAQRAAEGKLVTQENEKKIEPTKLAVSLTEEEKALKFRRRKVHDLGERAFAETFTSFSLPKQEEEFHSIEYEWDPAERCQDYLEKWISTKKLTQRIEGLQPSEWFRERKNRWALKVAAWKKFQQDRRLSAKKAAFAKAKEGAAAGKEEAEKSEEDGNNNNNNANNGEQSKNDSISPSAAPQTKAADGVAASFEDLDPWLVTNIDDVSATGGGVGDTATAASAAKGDPLYAKFEHEDWTLLSLRYEVHLLLHAFRRDVNDPTRPTFHKSHLPFYYQRYYGKVLSPKSFNVWSLDKVLEWIEDTVEVTASGTLEADLEEDTPLECFVRLAEEHRRERQLRVDMGDDSAYLKFVKVISTALSSNVPRPTSSKDHQGSAR
mmetsp:Transcript_6185/g.14367  ORF Transcript_6185/g.14367 Transcript_6185/m.14367 type:complete len:811 (+) Transcript_6185:154-2586(+)|eukprot:CAMPEP_0206443940 /NCGR_PEP_ID=MMETSP0324_2-20121206/14644_1 /ASSEMBLY_ACC=CAM_ASM_000836 /TAXON_ID=2866 /ORGANISM="Crypthecodinium cohnii, Strain Seligo" /LENGTH=810 /DNA_ID=CAMNT_0053911925 /DNA_START=77 /DNA_END=2509 /DNA_ORIENTATION=+